MITDIDALVTSYERGALTRRQLLQSLALLAAPAPGAAQGPSGRLSKGRNLHHVNLQVSDLARSEAFYRRLFDLSPSRRVQGPDNHGFDLPGGGLFILQKSDSPGRVDHFCVGVDEFDADRMRAAVLAAGIGAVQGGASDSFSVRDRASASRSQHPTGARRTAHRLLSYSLSNTRRVFRCASSR